jgi:hypothetical protein
MVLWLAWVWTFYDDSWEFGFTVLQVVLYHKDWCSLRMIISRYLCSLEEFNYLSFVLCLMILVIPCFSSSYHRVMWLGMRVVSCQGVVISCFGVWRVLFILLENLLFAA